MKCQDLQLNLPLYFDDVLSPEERDVLDDHMPRCPLCRQKLIDYQDLRNSLRAITRPEMPTGVLNYLRATVAAELLPNTAAPGFQLVEDRRNWFDVWLMPYAVGSFTSLVIGFTLLWVIMSSEFQAGIADASIASKSDSNSTILLARAERSGNPDTIDLTPSEYAATRLEFSGESPSINPSGALIALTKSFVRGEIKDNEVVVVADVFSNGLARIAEVVEPSHDLQAVAELQRAFESDPSFAPFVPANLDQRSETVRVVFRIQRVNVSTRQR